MAYIWERYCMSGAAVFYLNQNNLTSKYWAALYAASTYSGSLNNIPSAVTLDYLENTYVVGKITVNAFYDAAQIVKYDMYGRISWQRGITTNIYPLYTNLSYTAIDTTVSSPVQVQAGGTMIGSLSPDYTAAVISSLNGTTGAESYQRKAISPPGTETSFLVQALTTGALGSYSYLFGIRANLGVNRPFVYTYNSNTGAYYSFLTISAASITNSSEVRGVVSGSNAQDRIIAVGGQGTCNFIVISLPPSSIGFPYNGCYLNNLGYSLRLAKNLVAASNSFYAFGQQDTGSGNYQLWLTNYDRTNLAKIGAILSPSIVNVGSAPQIAIALTQDYNNNKYLLSQDSTGIYVTKINSSLTQTWVRQILIAGSNLDKAIAVDIKAYDWSGHTSFKVVLKLELTTGESYWLTLSLPQDGSLAGNTYPMRINGPLALQEFTFTYTATGNTFSGLWAHSRFSQTPSFAYQSSNDTANFFSQSSTAQTSNTSLIV